MTDTAQRFLADLRAIRHVLEVMERRVAEGDDGARFNALDMQTIELLRANPGLRSGKLAELLGVVPTTASSTIARLRRKGLLTIESDSVDRRAVTLWLTPEGRDLAEKVLQEGVAAMNNALGVLEDEDRHDLVRLLGDVVQRSAH